MNADAIPSLFSTALARFSQAMGKLREAISLHVSPPLTLRGSTPLMPTALAEHAWHRLRRAETLFLALAARFRAGKLRPSKPDLAPRLLSKGRLSSVRGPDPESASKTPIPRRFGWLLGHIRHHGVYANHLRLLLAEPEMQELLATSPRARRILAPSCHMLGLEKALLTPAQQQSAIETTTCPEPASEPPPARTPATPINRHLLVLWRPQSDP